MAYHNPYWAIEFPIYTAKSQGLVTVNIGLPFQW